MRETSTPATSTSDAGLLAAAREVWRATPPHQAQDLTIGRDDERAALATMLRDGTTRLVTILGPGGVGKTHLALAVAAEIAPGFDDGIAILTFTHVTPDGVWEAIAHHLGIAEVRGVPLHAAVRDAIGERQLLLVLDNCETILDGVGELPAVLAACPNLVLLATSREALGLREEREFWLQPLGLPEPASDAILASAHDASAVTLFTARARRVVPGFTVTDDNVEDIVAIVRRLDGLPLAIELAAAQLRHLSPAALQQRLTAALPSLGGGSRDLPERHQSLRATVMWSLGLLPEYDRDAFLQLALFAGGITPEAASAVLEDIPDQHGWDLLLAFADKSLLQRVIDTDEARPRFLMLETVRAVALDLLHRNDRLFRAARARHARYVIALAREASRSYHGPDQLLWLQRIDTEHANIAAVMDADPDDADGVRAALELAGPMFWFWYTRGYHTWALPLLERLLRLAPDDVPAATRGAAHVTAGWLAFKQAQVERADRHFARAHELIPEPSTPVALLGRIGAAYVLSFDRTDTQGAIRMLREVGERAHRIESAWHEEAAAHFGIGLLEYFDRHLPEARASFEASIRILRAQDDRQGIAMNLVYLAHCDRLTGDPRAALWKLQAALPLLFEVGDRATIALTLDAVVATLVDLRERDLARRVIAVDQHLRQAFGIPRTPLERPDYVDALERLDAEMAGQPAREPEQISLNEAIDLLLQFRPATTPPASGAETGDGPATTPATVLSAREIEVLRLVAAGLTAAEIATTLFLSRHTVKRHMANIRQKLGVRSQAAAVAVLQRAERHAAR
jgi:non-specific serine/threonine protein kinase